MVPDMEDRGPFTNVAYTRLGRMHQLVETLPLCRNMFAGFLQSYAAFKRHGAVNPLHEALLLLDLLLEGVNLEETDSAYPRQNQLDFISLAQKREKGIPLEYIIEQVTFMGLVFFCNRNTLIPRQETELLVKVALGLIRAKENSKNHQTIIDMGTGCGNVGISLAMNSANSRILAADISPAAIEIAQKNVHKFKLEDRVSLFCGDLFAPFQNTAHWGNVDLVVCNPPYIPTESLSKLAHEIIDYEPTIALDAGNFGLEFYRKLIAHSPAVLRPEGILLFQIGEGQEMLVTRLLQRSKDYHEIRYYRDEAQLVRVISVRRR